MNKAVLNAVIVLVVLFIFIPNQARATVFSQDCMQGIGARTPILLIHGAFGDNRTWTSEPAMQEELSRIEGVYVDLFEYKPNNVWVTDSRISPNLAERIVCIAQSSKNEGGAGKLVVVANSMGALLLRQVANTFLNGAPVADRIGLVITIAAPNLGSDTTGSLIDKAKEMCQLSALIGTTFGITCDETILMALDVFTAIPALRAGSQELASLSSLSNNVPVLAIAGNIHQHYSLFGYEFDDKASGADGWVSTKSALQGNIVNKQGGTVEFESSGSTIPFVGDAPCGHEHLPQNREVQKTIGAAIRQYQRSLQVIVNPCPTWDQVKQSIYTKFREWSANPEKEVTFTLRAGPACEGGYAGVVVLQSSMMQSGDFPALLRLQDGVWKYIKGGDGGALPDADCRTMPQKVRLFFYDNHYCSKGSLN